MVPVQAEKAAAEIDSGKDAVAEPPSEPKADAESVWDPTAVAVGVPDTVRVEASKDNPAGRPEETE